jgi:YHS domain-containing protein
MTNPVSFRKLLFLILAAGIAAAASLGAQKSAVNVSSGDLAVKGYDVVAYQDGAVALGTAAFEHQWNGARWRFSSVANRDKFAAAPEKYAPQFGGYCAYAVSRGYTADADPNAFKVVDGALYLNYSLGVQRTWERDVPGNISKARQNWPAVLKK